ncbi:MAG: hypothetical protein Q9227_008964 [Pyrenula ochraceoflavens]
MADGFARVTGRPQAVIVHVDVGTQALAHGVHNASIGRSPVFVFAGLCPFTESGELEGSRTEYMHWLQDAPDQKDVVRQYCRYTSEVRTGLNMKQMVNRALQFAESDPKGPVYLAAAREVLAQEIEPYSLPQGQWSPVSPSALPQQAVKYLAETLVDAERPLVITAYSGRNRKCPKALETLADLIPGLRVFDTGGSDMCFPMTHRASQGFRLATGDYTKDTDMVLMLDCDVPWLPYRNPPPATAKLFSIDVDPLNQMMPVSFFPAHQRWKADCLTALEQTNAYLENDHGLQQKLKHRKFPERRHILEREHRGRVGMIRKLGQTEGSSTPNAHSIGQTLKSSLPLNTVWVVEAVTCAQSISDQFMVDTPGSWLNFGATGIGWSNGAALGVRLGLDEQQEQERDDKKLVCQIVGDGSYMCGSPASAAWVAAKYNIRILTIVLNNGGWNAPRNSMELVHPHGLAANAKNDDINISFQPSPNYAALAAAAAEGCGETFARRVKTVKELQEILQDAVSAVKQGRNAVVEVLMQTRA